MGWTVSGVSLFKHHEKYIKHFQGNTTIIYLLLSNTHIHLHLLSSPDRAVYFSLFEKSPSQIICKKAHQMLFYWHNNNSVKLLSHKLLIQNQTLWKKSSNKWNWNIWQQIWSNNLTSDFFFRWKDIPYWSIFYVKCNFIQMFPVKDWENKNLWLRQEFKECLCLFVRQRFVYMSTALNLHLSFSDL